MVKMERTLSPNEKAQDGFLFLVILMVGTGLAILFSTSSFFFDVVRGNPFHMVKRQIIWIGMGVVAAIVLSRFSSKTIKEWIPYIVAGVIILNLMTYVPFLGKTIGGARRWIGFPFSANPERVLVSFQPSELIKIVLPLYLARMYEKRGDKMGKFTGVLPQLIVVFVFTGVVYFQNDFSTAVYIFALGIILLFIAGMAWWQIVLLILSFGFISVIMVMSKQYRIDRMLVWFSPDKDPSGTGYQMLAAWKALSSGGFWGVGIGCGEAKTGALPQAYSDFTAAIIGEELGFAGIIFVISLFFAFLWKGVKMFNSAIDPFCGFAAFGLALAVFLQAIVNLSVVAGVFPATGIALPFFSSGGSASLTTLIAAGLILSFSGEERARRRWTAARAGGFRDR